MSKTSKSEQANKRTISRFRNKHCGNARFQVKVNGLPSSPWSDCYLSRCPVFATSEEEALLLWGSRLVAGRKKPCCSFLRIICVSLQQTFRVIRKQQRSSARLPFPISSKTLSGKRDVTRRPMRIMMSNNVYKRYGGGSLVRMFAFTVFDLTEKSFVYNIY